MRGATVLFLLMLVGCTTTDYELIADQPRLPPDLFDGAAVLVDRDEDMAAAWDHFQLAGTVPAIDSPVYVALFLGTGESGSCPIEIEGVSVSGSDFVVETAERGGLCTADFNPRTFVFLLPLHARPEIGGTATIGGSEYRIEDVSDV